MLGQRLKLLRETHQESLAEVSGAVEIDTDMMERIEKGEERPSEDILTLLINHFSLHEHEAVQLWEWAGFEHAGDAKLDSLSDIASKATLVVVALDARVLYSDEATITSNKSGIILNFSQTSTQSQQLPVARIGMSYEQAEQVLQALQRALLRHTYLPNRRLLPPGDTN